MHACGGSYPIRGNLDENRSIYGRSVTTQVRTIRALWYAALRDQPVQIVLVRDPTGKRRDEAFFCTAPAAEARFILEAYARRWCLENRQPYHPYTTRVRWGAWLSVLSLQRRTGICGGDRRLGAPPVVRLLA
jgi:hypothetical protein